MMKHDLQLSSEIFSRQAVEAAIRAYSGLALIQVESQPGAGCFPSPTAGMIPS